MNEELECSEHELFVLDAIRAVFFQASKDFDFALEEVEEGKVKIACEHIENSGIFIFTAFRYEAQIAEFHVDYSALISGQTALL